MYQRDCVRELRCGLAGTSCDICNGYNMFISKEKTPDGKLQHEAGAKLDAGKQKPALVLGDFARALQAVTEVGTFGANKYSEHGWLSVENASNRYQDAMMRHWLKMQHEELDPDSGLPHLAHFAWNALAILEFSKRK